MDIERKNIALTHMYDAGGNECVKDVFSNCLPCASRYEFFVRFTKNGYRCASLCRESFEEWKDVPLPSCARCCPERNVRSYEAVDNRALSHARTHTHTHEIRGTV